MPAVSQLSRLSPRDSHLHWLCYTPCMRVSHPKLRRSFSSAGHVFFQGICWQGQATTCLQIPFTPAAGDYSHFNTFIFFLETLLLHVFISLLLHFLIRFPSPFHFPHRAGWFPRSVIRFFAWLYYSILPLWVGGGNQENTNFCKKEKGVCVLLFLSLSVFITENTAPHKLDCKSLANGWIIGR